MTRLGESSASKRNISTLEDEEMFENVSTLSSSKRVKVAEKNVNNPIDSRANGSSIGCDENARNGYDVFAGRTWHYPANYHIRDYQFNIIKNALSTNTWVSLPTGLGKNFIAAVIMYNFYRWYPLGKIVFIANKEALLAQQFDACYQMFPILPSHMIKITANMSDETREEHWQRKWMVFTTPHVINRDLQLRICPADMIKCLVISGAHKAAKHNNAYSQIVATLDEMGHNNNYRVLALSATVGRKMDDVVNVVRSLHIANLEFRTEISEDVAPYSLARELNIDVSNMAPPGAQSPLHFAEMPDDKILATQGLADSSTQHLKLKQRNKFYKTLLQSNQVKKNLYKWNPRMMPNGHTPKCQKIYVSELRNSEESDRSPKKRILWECMQEREEFDENRVRSKQVKIDIHTPNSLTAPLSQKTKNIIEEHSFNEETAEILNEKSLRKGGADTEVKVEKLSPDWSWGSSRTLFSSQKYHKSPASMKSSLDLGFNDEDNTSPRLRELFEVLHLNGENFNGVKQCFVCQNIYDCKGMQHQNKSDVKASLLLQFLKDPILPDIHAIDYIVGDTIRKCAKRINPSQSVDYDDGDTMIISDDEAPIDADESNKHTRSKNITLLFDFDALDDIASPEPPVREQGDDINCLSDIDIDEADVNMLFADSDVEKSKDKVEIASENTGIVNEEKDESTETNKTLAFFGLERIEDIFDDDDDFA